MKKKLAFLLVVVVAVLFGEMAHATVYWTPQGISTTAWFDANDASTITASGSDVTKWDDKSGHGYNLTTTTAYSPTTGTNTLNGLNVLAFAQGDKMTGTIALPSNGNVSSYIVFDFISSDSSNRVLTQFGGNQLLPASTTNPPYKYGTNFSGGPYPDPVIVELAHDKEASKTYGYITGNQRLERDYLFNVTDTGLRLMRNANNAAGIAGLVGEFVIVPDSTPETRMLVEGYLAHKWGLAADLPVAHPFKAAAPSMLSFDNGSADFAWETAENWDPNETPISTALVTIDSGDGVTLSTAGQVAVRLDIGKTTAGSALSVSGELTVGALGATVGSNGSLAVTGKLVAPKLNTAGAVTVGPAADLSGVGQLNLTGGTLTGSGAMSLSNINGALNWTNGTIGNIAGGDLTFTAVPITLLAGTHTFDISGSNTATLDAASPIGGGSGITKAGTGTLVLAGANTYTGNTAVNEGTLSLADNAQLKFVIGASGANNVISGTGTLSLAGDFLFDLTGAGTSPGDQWQIVAGSLSETYLGTFAVVGFTDAGGNKWTKAITDSDNTYQFDEATGMLKVVEASLAGDANNDGVVDAADYIILKRNMGQSANAGPSYGDFNDSGTTDWADLQILAGAMNAGAAGNGTIPEPATLGLLAFGAAAVLRRRKRS